MPAQRGFVYGAVWLAGAAMLTKLLGSVYTIVLQNIIGDSGMGLFQMAYPVYATLLAVATAGFPVAISKMVSEHLARGDVLAVRQTLRVAAWWLTAAGAAACVLLYGGAEVWAAWAGDVRAAAALRAVAPALL
ncbi:MAG: oligosaccharide flippase family protein, partial [Alicyclobacillus sp.]|nr:oligosaccharide flippase family protein [Alicyclobacillus sp.]